MTRADKIAVANAIATALMPLTVVGVAYFLDRRVKKLEQSFEREHQLTSTRFELYKDIGFQLNDLYAYFNYIGMWKDLSPADVIRRKRELDRHIYTYRPLFNKAFFQHYMKFADAAFRTNTGWRENAKLRTWSVHRAEDGDPDQMPCFTQEDNLKAIKESYADLLACLADNLAISKEDK